MYPPSPSPYLPPLWIPQRLVISRLFLKIRSRNQFKSLEGQGYAQGEEEGRQRLAKDLISNSSRNSNSSHNSSSTSHSSISNNLCKTAKFPTEEVAGAEAEAADREDVDLVPPLLMAATIQAAP